MKVKTVIGFRPSPEIAADFANRVEALGVTDSKLASLAFMLGINQATKYLANERADQASTMMKRIKSFGLPDFQPSGFNLIAA